MSTILYNTRCVWTAAVLSGAGVCSFVLGTVKNISVVFHYTVQHVSWLLLSSAALVFAPFL